MLLKNVRYEEYAILMIDPDHSANPKPLVYRRGVVRGFVRKRGHPTLVQVEWLDEITGASTGDTAEVEYRYVAHTWAEHCKAESLRAEKRARRQRTVRALDRLRAAGYGSIPDPYSPEGSDITRVDWCKVLDVQKMSFITLPITIVEDLLVRLDMMAPEERTYSESDDPNGILRAELAWLESASVA